MKVKLIASTMNPEDVVAKAGKLCYSPVGVDDMELKEGEAEKFVGMLAELGHESPLEHASYSFAIEGVSRITEIQLVRHRIASYSIQSGRYVKRDYPNFIYPPSFEQSDLLTSIYDNVIRASTHAYNELFTILMLKKIGYTDSSISLKNYEEHVEIIAEFQGKSKKLYNKYEKECMEDARYAHLQSLSTKIVVTMNARTLLNFFNKRLCDRAQWEIRELALEMLKEVRKVSPNLFKKAGPKCITGKCPEGAMTCGNPKMRI